MIDINSLSKAEVLELERQIQEYKKTEKFLTVYKVAFCVKFNPENHSTSLGDIESFGDWLCDIIPNKIINSFNLKKPEDVSGFEIVEMTNTPIVPEKSIKEWKKLGYISPEPDFRQLGQELVDDLDAWMEFDKQPSLLWKEYENSLNLIKKVRRALKECKND